MSRRQNAFKMCRRVRKVTRHGVVTVNRSTGRLTGYTWQARIKVVGGDSVAQVAELLARKPGPVPEILKGRW
jgi:hypothetical protein